MLSTMFKSIFNKALIEKVNTINFLRKEFIYNIFFIALLIVISSALYAKDVLTDGKVYLNNNWMIKPVAKAEEQNYLQKSNISADKWYVSKGPTTILANLIENGVYEDPFYGRNIEQIPGYRAGIWRIDEMPEGSPFRDPWWFKTEFKVPGNFKDKIIWIHFPGINYKADIWLNGQMIANHIKVEGAFRTFNFNITNYLKYKSNNCLVLKIYPPKGLDLSIAWVDWNPTPPDRDTGIWYPPYIYATGPVMLNEPYVVTDLKLPSLEKAFINISTKITNVKENKVSGVLKGFIKNVDNIKEGGTSHEGSTHISFSKPFILEANETKMIKLTSSEFKGLIIDDPRLWWPNLTGDQNLYELKLETYVNGILSGSNNVTFGIREISSRLGDSGNRIFQINGKDVLIRGAGYVDDMLMRYLPEKNEKEIAYAKHMNLNALRMEGIRGSDYIYELCDKYGIMVIAGLCCCSAWERWSYWDKHTADIAEKSLIDQIIRLRNHPSVIDWLYGSDKYPPDAIEERYISVINTYDGARPYQSSATSAKSTVAEPTGFYMGPFPEVYAYLPPAYWYSKLEFNLEAGPSGEQISPVQSMRKMMPENDLWPMGKSWDIRLNTNFYPKMRDALFSRYGESQSLEEYSLKSQILQLEATKAMFEAYAKNKYKSSGIIYWMFNSAWPTLYWQLFDYYLTPNGAFYGAKSACEPLHIQYSYDDSTIYVLNNRYEDFTNYTIEARIYDINMDEKYQYIKKDVFLPADSSNYIATIKFQDRLKNIFFLKLSLKNKFGETISSNFYWLSQKGDDNADFTALSDLPEVALDATYKFKKTNNIYTFYINLKNTTEILAFAINPAIIKDKSNDMVLPVFWEDNYFALLPGESREVKVTFNKKDLGSENPVIVIDGLNIKYKEIPTRIVENYSR